MSIWDTLMDAIKGLPEAAVLRAHVAFLRDQFTAMESKAHELATKDVISQQKIANLELEKANIQQQVRNLEEQLSARSRDRLEPLKERILELLKTTAHFTTSEIAQELRETENIIEYHLQQMEDEATGFVDRHMIQDEPSKWYRTPKGSEYLNTYNLLQ